MVIMCRWDHIALKPDFGYTLYLTVIVITIDVITYFVFNYFSRTSSRDVAQHNAASQVSITRSTLLLPALLGRQAHHVHQVHLSGPPETDVQLERHWPDRGQSGKPFLSEVS